MNVSKERLIELIKESKEIKVFVADFERDTCVEGLLNEVLLRKDGTLELWYNDGFEI